MADSNILVGAGINQAALVVFSNIEIVATIVGDKIPTQYGYDVTIRALTGEQFVVHSYNINQYCGDGNFVLLPGICSAINGAIVSVTLLGITPDIQVNSFSLNGGSVPGGPGRYFL